jgi:Uroporphyrinogen decarboxylase (URO-D)
MEKRLSARERFRAVFEHNTAELDRLPMLSLGTPSQGLFYQSWVKDVADSEDFDDSYVRLTHWGDKTIQKWISSEWQNSGLGGGKVYPSVPLPKDHFEWGRQPKGDGDEITMKIGSTGNIGLSGTKMHGESYGWYVNGYFTRQKLADGTVLQPWEVREKFFEEHGNPFDAEYNTPSEESKKHFQENLKWYEANYNNFSEQGFHDFALMTGGGGLFEGTWEGMGSGTSGMSIMCRKYPGKLQEWLGDVTNQSLDKLKLQFELAEEVDAQIDFVWLWDDTGQKGRPLIDPHYHKMFWVENYKKICDLVHKHNAFVIIHSCGYGESICPNWIEAGIDAWQTIERAALNDPARIREKYGNKIIMIGAIDASDTVSFADTEEEIVQHVKQTMKDAVYSVDDASYIPGFTHDLLDCPVNNVRVAVDSMLKYGQIDEIRKLKNS